MHDAVVFEKRARLRGRFEFNPAYICEVKPRASAGLPQHPMALPFPSLCVLKVFSLSMVDAPSTVRLVRHHATFPPLLMQKTPVSLIIISPYTPCVSLSTLFMQPLARDFAACAPVSYCCGVSSGHVGRQSDICLSPLFHHDALLLEDSLLSSGDQNADSVCPSSPQSSSQSGMPRGTSTSTSAAHCMLSPPPSSRFRSMSDVGESALSSQWFSVLAPSVAPHACVACAPETMQLRSAPPLPHSLPLWTVRVWIAELLCGLQFLLQCGVKDRLLPEKILVARDGHIKVLYNYGLAESSARKAKEAVYALDAERVAYSAPEVLLGKTPDVPSLWWLFGVVSFRLLTGKFPFPDCPSFYAFMSSPNEMPQLNMPPELSDSCKEMFQQILHKDPEKRRGFCETLRVQPFFMPLNWELVETQSYPVSLPAVWHDLLQQATDRDFSTISADRTPSMACPSENFEEMQPVHTLAHAGDENFFTLGITSFQS